MAEVLGIVASGIAIAQLASSVVLSTQKLSKFWSDLKGAPKQIGDVLKELEMLGKVTEHIEMPGQSGGPGEKLLKEALYFCSEVIGEFESLLERFREDLE